ncbi:MAG: HAMP domain-containing protein [Elusimicrobia bacterium]|nr:HAMP domain-containing protein [Elusimicrobiota bacterium]
MKTSIFHKVFGGYILIIVALSALIIVFSFNTIRNHYINLLTNNLESLGASLKLKVEPVLQKEKFEELDALIKELGKEINTRITVILSNGMVVADSEENPGLMENHRTRPEIMDAVESGFGKSIRYSTTLEKEMLYVALPINSGDNKKVLAVLRISLFLSDINVLLNKLKIDILKISIAIIIISVLVALFFSSSLSKPIGELMTASHKIASGDFDTKVLFKSKDELSRLADSFNNMSEQMKRMFEKLSQQKDELNNIISSIQEALLLIDKDGQILLFNDSFKELSGNQIVEKKYYWEVLRVPEFGDLIKRVTIQKKSLVQEIMLNNQVYLCSVAFLSNQQEMVVLFHNITDLKNLEKIKRDFVTNVSHELRTPLTAIKGFTETLEEGVDGKNRHYVDVIKGHTERLIRIVQDLLMLSELEEKGNKLELKDINLVNIMENISRLFIPKAKDKNLEFKVNIDKNVANIKADSFKLEQILINLIDNAIKYTEKGGIEVFVKLKDESVVFDITDTGIGIPNEYLPRIFERFFVVDKSHSRKLGGTGLGLSIVKHIVQLHNGKIDIESTVGKGTKFVITLPINHA